jgi:hypothetical protein
VLGSNCIGEKLSREKINSFCNFFFPAREREKTKKQTFFLSAKLKIEFLLLGGNCWPVESPFRRKICIYIYKQVFIENVFQVESLAAAAVAIRRRRIALLFSPLLRVR